MRRGRRLALYSVAVVGVVGVRQRVSAVAAVGLVDQPGKMKPTLNGFIVDEPQCRHSMNVKQFEQQGMEPAGFLVERRCGSSGLSSENSEIDLGMCVVGG